MVWILRGLLMQHGVSNCWGGLPEGQEEGVGHQELYEGELLLEPVKVQLSVRQIIRVQDHVPWEEPWHVLDSKKV